MKILLVEDDAAHARIVRRVLDEVAGGDEILHVADGDQALDVLLHPEDRPRSETPGLVLLDLRLPTVSGFEVLEALQKDEEARHIPVIVLSTSDEPEDMNRSYGLGANAYLVKPGDYNIFASMLRAARDFWGE